MRTAVHAALCIVLVIMSSTLSSCEDGEYMQPIIALYVLAIIVRSLREVSSHVVSVHACVCADEKVSIACDTGCNAAISRLKCFLMAYSEGKVLVSSNCETPTRCGCVFRHKQDAALIAGDVGNKKGY